MKAEALSALLKADGARRFFFDTPDRAFLLRIFFGFEGSEFRLNSFNLLASFNCFEAMFNLTPENRPILRRQAVRIEAQAMV